MSILDFVFPKRCVGCKKLGTYFCQECKKNSEKFFPQLCPICEKPAIDGFTHEKCRTKFSPYGLWVIWKYRKAPKNAILKLKYKFISDLAFSLSTAVVDNLEQTVLRNQSFVVVPIPLHWTRKNWRGFNHTEELAKYFVKAMGWEMKNLLARKRHTDPQVGKKGRGRKENVKDVFTLNPRHSQFQIHNSILLFDDVWTTGSTMLAAVKTLKKAGFNNIWCLALAR